jgi:NAD+ synthase (glutamine-hydrolysing)
MKSKEVMMISPTKYLGFVKVASCSFPITLGDADANSKEIVKNMEEAVKQNVQILVFPELCLTGYTCGDLFLRKELYEQAESALRNVKAATRDHNILVCVGMPVEDHGKLFNCAIWLQAGDIKGVVPKTYIPNYCEFYEKRWFVSSTCRTSDTISLLGCTVPFSENLLLRGENDVVIATEICEDLWVDCPPSGMLGRAGATIIVNPSASNDTIGKSEYRRDLVKMQSGRCRAGYIYASSGIGESSSDLVFSGHCMIAENGSIISEGRDTMVVGVIDVEKCVNDRRKYNSDVWGKVEGVVESKVFMSAYPYVYPEKVSKYPFVPSDVSQRDERCTEILNLQSRGLIQRLKSCNIDKVVIGLSGGLDSTLALVVCYEAFQKMNISVKNIHCISMPGFGTSERTRTITQDLATNFGVSFKKIDITAACKQHLSDLGHAEDVYDITYENTQARERTQILFDYANMIGGIVIGTGDMSELALGWCTYNGDHMSNYAVNCGVPKTLVKYIISAYADCTTSLISETLKKVVLLPISPELLPTDESGEIAQKTEESIGKYDLHDFFLYNYIRNGFSRDKIAVLASIAFDGVVSDEEIERTLDTFYTRFRTQQFKRDCIPNGVKIGSVSLSPRGDWRMPSDIAKLY